MEEVPHQHKHMWAWAWCTVLERFQNARSEEETTRSLKWFLFLSQALLRTPREGGEAGRGFVAKRFNCLAERKWGELVKLWEDDVQQVEGRHPREIQHRVFLQSKLLERIGMVQPEIRDNRVHLVVFDMPNSYRYAFIIVIIIIVAVFIVIVLVIFVVVIFIIIIIIIIIIITMIIMIIIIIIIINIIMACS